MILGRNISRQIVKEVLCSGEVIEDYPNDWPYPSALFFGRSEIHPIHVVAAFSEEQDLAFVITVYQPDLDHFEADYRTRKK